MRKKTLKIMTWFIIGLFSAQQGIPMVQNFFIDPVYALEQSEVDAEQSSSGTEPQDVEISFSTENKKGSLGETLLIEFTCNQPLDEIDLVMPAEAKIVTSALPEGVVIHQLEAQQWRLLSRETLSEFLVPLTFEEAGVYEIQVADETLAVEIEQTAEAVEEESMEAEDLEHSAPDAEGQADEEAENSEDETKNARDDIFTSPDPDLPFDPTDRGNLHLLEGQEYEERGVSNWTEFLEAIMDVNVQYIYFERSFNSTNPAVPSNIVQGETVGYFTQNNFNNTSSNNVMVYLRQAQVARTLIIDGKGLTLDLQAVHFAFDESSFHPTNNWDITIQNIKLFSGSHHGAFSFGTASAANLQRSMMRYHNVIHEGSNLIRRNVARMCFSGYVSADKSNTYYSIFNPAWDISSINRDSPNIYVSQVTIEPDATVSFSNVNGGNMNATEILIGEYATVTLEADGSNVLGQNISFASSAAELRLGKGATLNLYPRENHGSISTPFGSADINLLEDSTMNIVSKNPGISSDLIRLTGESNLTLGERSALNIETLGQTNSFASIIQLGGTKTMLTVGKDAILDIRSESLNKPFISFDEPNNADRFVIDQAKRVNLQRLTSAGNGNLIRGGGITARRQSVKQWQYGNITNDPDFHWDNIFSMTANVSSAAEVVTNVTGVTSFLPDTEVSFQNSFDLRSNRLLFEQIPTLEVAIDLLKEDPAYRNSHVISGRATPESYIRFEREGALPEPELSTVISGAQEIGAFHTIADEEGYFEFDLSQYKPFERFKGGELVTAHAMLNGEWASTTVIVERMPDMDPKDPLQPDNTIDPDNPPDLGVNRGIISIDFISQFNFGSVPIRSSRSFYSARPQRLNNAAGDIFGSERPNFIQVTDRRAENSGWTLSARLGEEGFVSNDGHKLRGVELSLNNINMVTTGSNNSMRPHYWESRVLNTGRQPLAMAGADQGGGTWIQRYGDQHTMGDSVILEVPSGAVPQATAYTGTIYWELSFVPGME